MGLMDSIRAGMKKGAEEERWRQGVKERAASKAPPSKLGEALGRIAVQTEGIRAQMGKTARAVGSAAIEAGKKAAKNQRDNPSQAGEIMKGTKKGGKKKQRTTIIKEGNRTTIIKSTRRSQSRRSKGTKQQGDKIGDALRWDPFK